MELNLNREHIKGAVTGILYCEQQSSGYPRHPFTFNVLKQGNFWELQWIYTEDYEYKTTGVYDEYGRAEYADYEKTDSFKTPISEDADFDDLFAIIREALETIYKNEFTG